MSDELSNVDPTRDLPRRRIIPFDKNQIILECKDPFGLWDMHLQRGITPPALEGQYTSPEEAEKVIQSYLSQRSTILSKTAESN